MDMVKTFLLTLFVAASVLVSAQDEPRSGVEPVLLVPIASQHLGVPIKVLGPSDLKGTGKQSAVVALSTSNCYGDSTSAPVVRGGRSDHIITYIDGIPVRGSAASLIKYAVTSNLTGVAPEFEHAQTQTKSIFR